jgi:kynureninase
MCTLTANLHFLLNAFYKPTSQKYKILMEDKAFPSDHYAIISQVKQHGFNPDTDIIYLKPRKGEYLIREEDIFEAIEDENLALILLPGVQYYTGQVFPMEEITKLGQSRGVKVGFDLAHAVGNIPLELNKWNVDFACWCTYKYLASGPGNIGGLFVHERYANASEMNRLIGWWAHNPDTRFKMSNQLELSPGAAGFQLSNPSVTNVVALQGTLSIYNEFDMQMFREQSLLLTDYLELLIKSNSKLKSKIDIMTPEDSTRRGCQLSLLLIEEGLDLVKVYNELLHNGVMTDERHPNCVRVAPYPLINSFQEVRQFVTILEKVLN